MNKSLYALLISTTLCLSGGADEVGVDSRISSWEDAGNSSWGEVLEDVQTFLDKPKLRRSEWDYRLVRILTGWVNHMEVLYFREQNKVTECHRVTLDITSGRPWKILQDEHCALNSDEHSVNWDQIRGLHQTLKPRYFYSMNLGLWIWERKPTPDQKETGSLFIPVTDPNPNAWDVWKAGSTSQLIQAMHRELAHQRELHAAEKDQAEGLNIGPPNKQ